MGNDFNKHKVITSLFWKSMERGGAQGIQFIVQIILARLLSPKEFGSIAIVMVFINLAQVFVQSGFNTALIQKKYADELDFSSIFYLSLAIAGILYLGIYVSAPYIADFYRDPILIPVLRVIALTLFAGAFNSIQNSYVSRNLMFKKLFISSLGAMLISGIFGIVYAYQGFGIWALVIQQLTNQIFVTIIMWFTVKWRPKFAFSISKVKKLFSFGWKLLASSLINVLYMEIRTLIVGRIYSPATLGFYNRGEQFPKVIISNIDGSIQSVMLPTLSAHQDDRKIVKQMMSRSIKTSSFLIFPMMIGMTVVAETLIKIVLTDKWLPSVPFLQMFCISYALMPIHTANLQAINAMGRSDIFLRIEIIKKVVGLLVLVISLPLGVYAIAIGQVISSIISTFINAYPNKKLLEYSYKEQWTDIIPSLLISIVMGMCISLFSFLNLSTWNTLLIQIGVGVVIYYMLAKLFKLESLKYLIETLKHLFNDIR